MVFRVEKATEVADREGNPAMASHPVWL